MIEGLTLPERCTEHVINDRLSRPRTMLNGHLLPFKLLDLPGIPRAELKSYVPYFFYRQCRCVKIGCQKLCEHNFTEISWLRKGTNS